MRVWWRQGWGHWSSGGVWPVWACARAHGCRGWWCWIGGGLRWGAPPTGGPGGCASQSPRSPGVGVANMVRAAGVRIPEGRWWWLVAGKPGQRCQDPDFLALSGSTGNVAPRRAYSVGLPLVRLSGCVRSAHWRRQVLPYLFR